MYSKDNLIYNYDVDDTATTMTRYDGVYNDVALCVCDVTDRCSVRRVTLRGVLMMSRTGVHCVE